MENNVNDFAMSAIRDIKVRFNIVCYHNFHYRDNSEDRSQRSLLSVSFKNTPFFHSYRLSSKFERVRMRCVYVCEGMLMSDIANPADGI
jgi:hypothetical protein